LYYVSSVAVAVVLFFLLFNFLFFRKFQEPDLVYHHLRKNVDLSNQDFLNSKLGNSTINSFSKQSSMDYISNVP
jgi:hypothetical protein